jgi:hypothetical protein
VYLLLKARLFLDKSDRKAALVYRFTFLCHSDATQFGSGKTDLSGNRSRIDNPGLISLDLGMVISRLESVLHRE